MGSDYKRTDERMIGIAGVNTDWKSIPLRNGIGQKHATTLKEGMIFSGMVWMFHIIMWLV